MNALPHKTELHEYSLEKVLGAGNFGITYKAWDNNLGIPVAIKEFFPGELATRNDFGGVILSSEENDEFFQWALKRFVAEAKILAQFKHPNIARVSRYFLENETAYIVMDYEEGENLGTYLKQHKMTNKMFHDIFVPVLEGLKGVHEKQYLHRDIKPGNIYIRENKSPILLDFGAATLEIETNDADSISALTPGYAPIEQYFHDGEQGPWSDLYALGATMYKCLFGSNVAEAIERGRSINRNNHDPFVPARHYPDRSYDTEILNLVDWMLQLIPTDRPQSAEQALNFLEGKKDYTSTFSSFKYTPKNTLRNIKLLVTGTNKKGVVDALSTLNSCVTPDDCKSSITDFGRHKKQVEISLGYGSMKLSENVCVRLYVPPEKEEFRFLHETLQKDAIGLLLLIDNNTKNPLQDLANYMTVFRELIESTGVALGIHRTAEKPSPTNLDYHQLLSNEDYYWCRTHPIFDVDMSSYEDLSMMVKALILMIDLGIYEGAI